MGSVWPTDRANIRIAVLSTSLVVGSDSLPTCACISGVTRGGSSSAKCHLRVLIGACETIRLPPSRRHTLSASDQKLAAKARRTRRKRKGFQLELGVRSSPPISNEARAGHPKDPLRALCALAANQVSLLDYAKRRTIARAPFCH